VATGANPDSIRYFQDLKEVWTFNHTAGSITVFDPMTAAVKATIEVGGLLEEAVEDPAAHRVYVNVEDKNVLGVVDTQTHTRVATWPLEDCKSPTGLALDARHHQLLSACDGVMAVTDSTSGKAVTSFPIAERVDGNGFDPSTELAFASSGTGVLTIAHEDAPGKFRVVQTVKTQPSGRTMFLDPATHEVYIPAAETTPGAGGRASVVPNTLKILVLGMGN
jgi:DNA-binding beta-propeller fold protein YncE